MFQYDRKCEIYLKLDNWYFLNLISFISNDMDNFHLLMEHSKYAFKFYRFLILDI